MATFFSPPGGLTDLNEVALDDWDKEVRSYFESSTQTPIATFAGPRNQFFNPADGIEDDAVTQPVGWAAFPLPITTASASDEERWVIGDESRSGQVEYCEWSVDRAEDGTIVRITFTCEDREYFHLLARHQPETVLDLYREHVSPQVERRDIFDAAGRYLTQNRWNANSSTGAMHMIAAPNTIGAAIELAAGASVVRARPDGSVMTGAQELIRCGAYGVPNRHSDPTIGEAINDLARAGHTVSLADPPELSFESISFTGWSLPGGASPETVWRFTRGVEGHHVRGVLEVPEGAGFGIGDIEIDGQPIRFGGQVADKIRIKVVGLAHRLGQAVVRPLGGCFGAPLPSGAQPESLGAGPPAAMGRAAIHTRI
ncbi:hypothetical protein [Acuticoccus sediminis]|uniref:hypothetical protein n=1 Tax=Acuticoccus sediminis TaxID=2184697 RepID=UPI001CFEBBBF|nr:hypothetical protein [Acuticoccus sediminis]